MIERVKEDTQVLENMVWGGEATPPTEYQHDASKAPVLEEETFDFTIAPPDEE
jgi:hypothetical protein